ncbi:hypothetical protein FIBSPDRAFT_898913 [Athelia psychrophila]|uniref:Uncharacterized protein n=1 Tax=Athelia psychrophila TaxID=1759441 RepID=A0A166AFL7_9AGAM|nr:hypothetical protein FIBSPDRAFT_898913 [Fibularhizoctonia sp. CBS 109695]
MFILLLHPHGAIYASGMLSKINAMHVHTIAAIGIVARLSLLHSLLLLATVIMQNASLPDGSTSCPPVRTGTLEGQSAPLFRYFIDQMLLETHGNQMVSVRNAVTSACMAVDDLDGTVINGDAWNLIGIRERGVNVEHRARPCTRMITTPSGARLINKISFPPYDDDPVNAHIAVTPPPAPHSRRRIQTPINYERICQVLSPPVYISHCACPQTNAKRPYYTARHDVPSACPSLAAAWHIQVPAA